MARIDKEVLRRAAVRNLPGLLVFIYFFATWILPPPMPVRPEAHLGEASWHLVLTDAFLRGAQFGRDIVYTYGPWGFVENPQGDPRIYPWLFGARLLIAMAFVFGVSLVAGRRIRQPAGRFLFIAWVAILGDPISVLPMLLFAAAVRRDGESEWPGESTVARLTVHLLAVACALTMWIKFTGFVIVAALVPALAVQDFIRRRRPVISVEIAAAALAFWLLARQSLVTLPSYVYGALSMARSYGTEMFVAEGPYPELGYVAALMVAIAIPAAIISYYRRPWSLWPSFAWVVLLFFLQLKEAFVRHDSFHVWMGIVNGLLPCALLLICRAGFFDPETSFPPIVRGLTRTCSALVVLLSVGITATQIGTLAGFERFQLLARNMDAVKSLASGRSLSAEYRLQLEAFRRTKPLRQVAAPRTFSPMNRRWSTGTVWRSACHDSQAFAAYNSYLSGRNAAFFRGPNRPDFVFFDIAPIDKRYPSAAQPFSWLALMDCYLPAESSGRYLVLRAAGCEHASLDLMAETKVRAGQRIAVPDGGDYPVWVEIDMRLNRTGSIIAALASPPDTRLEVHTGLGQHIFSLSTEAGKSGFLLSPLLLDPASFGGLFVEGGIDLRTEVRDLSIVQSDRARGLYQPAIGLRLYRVLLHRRDRAL